VFSVHILDAIRDGLRNIDKKPAQSYVTELSDVEPLTDSEIDKIENEQVSSPNVGN
jgi:hypothetical protein